MKINGKNYRPIWPDSDDETKIKIIDQRLLPHNFVVVDLTDLNDIIKAIKEMYVRGAPLIGVTAAYGVYLILINSPEKDYKNYMISECNRLKAARPTAVNLAWAVDMMLNHILKKQSRLDMIKAAFDKAGELAETEAENCRKIGEYGAELIEVISRKKHGESVNILTHCNAGWLACVEYGTATAPMYIAFDKGINIHIWVDETRPLNQGARLTAWELGKHGISHTVITDNAGGHLMQHGMVDMVIVGTDRTTYTGDVANKIGTYLKALAAEDNNIPFYVALPSTTFDWVIKDGVKEIPIEERNPEEVSYVQGLEQGEIKSVRITPETSQAANFAFDVTPARLVTKLITERGICNADEEEIKKLFPERFN
ncbi:Methylthioribose-1-phosphate isomerase [Candidatus Magnetomoraceae bacterium gMMP-15]